jgi:hypothetical protein
MAFVSSALPQEEQNQFAPSGQTTANPLALLPPQAAQTGGSAGQGGATQGGAAPSSGTSTQFGSNASKLGDYLKANQDQVQGMANQIAGGLGSQFSGLQSNIDQAGQSFGSQVQGGYTAPNADIVKQAAANPTDFASNPDNVKAFQSQLNDQYTGPTNFESSAPYSNIQEGVTNAVQQAGQLNTYPGLSTYLQNNVEKNATPGQNTLDTTLLQGNQPAYQVVQNAAKPFASLSDYLANTAKTQNQGVQSAQTAAQQAAGNAQAQFTGPGGVVPTFANTLNTGAATAEQQRQAYNQAAGNLYNQDVPVEQAINAWSGNQWGGGSADQVSNQDVMNLGLTNYQGWDAPAMTDLFAPVIAANQPVNTPISAANYSTPDQYAKAAALQQLMGGNLNLPISAATQGQAGTAPAVPSAPPPSLDSILQQYLPSIGGAELKTNIAASRNPADVGDTLNRQVGSNYANLMKYLNSVDPQFATGFAP